MSACATQHFTNVTQSVWDCLVKTAASNGITISGPKGCASKEGFTVCWDWNQGAKTLSMQCTKSPFIVPCSTINGKIHDMVTGCGATQDAVLTA